MNECRWSDERPGLPATNFEVVALNSGDFGSTSVIPGKAEALWNVRFTADQTPEKIVDTLRQQLLSAPAWAAQHPDVAALTTLELTGNLNSASYPYYSPPSGLAENVRQAVKNQTGTTPTLDAAGGVTDGRFVPKHFPDAEIVELGLPENGGEHTSVDSTSHVGGMLQIDESCSLTDLMNLKTCYAEAVSGYWYHWRQSIFTLGWLGADGVFAIGEPPNNP